MKDVDMSITDCGYSYEYDMYCSFFTVRSGGYDLRKLNFREMSGTCQNR